MSFRKRNAVLSSTPRAPGHTVPQPIAKPEPVAGLRPSPLDGRLTTSTGTQQLDAILAGHAGLPLGTSLLIEEHGATDFAGVLLKYYAAEGLVQGHHVHVLGFGEPWKNELPGMSTKQAGAPTQSAVAEDKMKIAWRYESFGPRAPAPVQDRGDGAGSIFCHSFDLSKRLAPTSVKGTFTSQPSPPPLLSATAKAGSDHALTGFIKHVQAQMNSSPPNTIHRVIVPSLLSPALYSPDLCDPSKVLPFLHALRSLLRQYKDRLLAILTVPLSLQSRSHGLTRWMELLSDGVLELIPLTPTTGSQPAKKADAKSPEQIQGMVKVHTLPVFSERGGGGVEGEAIRQDLSFHLSGTQGLVIKPYTLPPMEDEDHHEKSPASTVKDGIDF